MSPLLIYTPQNGSFLKELLDAMVAFLNTSTFSSAIDIMMILSVGMVCYQYVSGKKLESLMGYTKTTFLVTYCALGIKMPAAIIDMQTAEGAGSALTVSDVPLGVALPAALISGIGYGLASGFSDVFHMPDSLEYNKTGLIFGARTWLAATQTTLSMSPELAADLSAYIRQCVFSAKLLASHQIDPNDLVHSSALIKTYFEAPSPIYRVIFHDGTNRSCVDAAVNIKSRLPNAAKKELERLNQLVTTGGDMKGNPGSFSDRLQAAHQYYMGISTDSAEILTQNILINATRDAASDAFAFSGADAALMNYTNTSSVQKMHVAEANSFWLAGFRLPYYMTVMWMLTVCIFPLVILIAYLPLSFNVYFIYVQSQVFLWSWPPMFIILHWFVSLASSISINLFGEKTGGVTFSNIETLAAMQSNFAYTAGALAISVPVIAYFITKGLGSILSNASQHFGGITQSLSISEAQNAAQGNVSMASYSGWNMNYENTNAHKFDTNSHHAEGRSTLQMGNGAMLSQNADGSRVGNVQPAISSGAVSVHGSERVIDSLHRSAQESFSNAAQNRTAADSHLQAGLNEMNQFTGTDGQDIRRGSGVSTTESASISQDLRTMKDAVHHYNKHHDVSGQVSLDAAVTERLSSNKQVLGKLFELGTGASIEGSVTARAQGSTNHSAQWFNNSSEGQSFNEAFNHMVTTAQQSHLDAADSNNLSRAEQIGANFASSKSLMEQSSMEYAHGQQLQHAASHAVENAKSIDSNMNQAYHDWAVSRYGSDAETMMLRADSQSIATQNQWAAEFLNSNAGHSAVSSQVKSSLAQTGSSLNTEYKHNAQELTNAHNIQKQYHQDGEHVASTAAQKGLTPMSSANIRAAKNIQADHGLQPTLKNAHHLEEQVKGALSRTDKDVNYKKLNKDD